MTERPTDRESTFTVTPTLLAEVIRAAWLRGWNGRARDIESADEEARAYALGELATADMPTEGIVFQPAD